MPFLMEKNEVARNGNSVVAPEEIMNIPIDFIPTMKMIDAKMHGSREMSSREDATSTLRHGIRESTDFDFFAQQSELTEKILQEVGFHKVDNNYFKYPNQLFVACYTKTFHDSYVPAKVQVILLSDAKTYEMVWESIDPKFYSKYIWKNGMNKPSREQISAIMNQLITTFLSF
jgi:hypothetical protein